MGQCKLYPGSIVDPFRGWGLGEKHGLPFDCEFAIAGGTSVDIGTFSSVASRPRRLAAVAAVHCRDSRMVITLGKFLQCRGYKTETTQPAICSENIMPAVSARGSEFSFTPIFMALMGGSTARFHRYPSNDLSTGTEERFT